MEPIDEGDIYLQFLELEEYCQELENYEWQATFDMEAFGGVGAKIKEWLAFIKRIAIDFWNKVVQWFSDLLKLYRSKLKDILEYEPNFDKNLNAVSESNARTLAMDGTFSDKAIAKGIDAYRESGLFSAYSDTYDEYLAVSIDSWLGVQDSMITRVSKLIKESLVSFNVNMRKRFQSFLGKSYSLPGGKVFTIVLTDPFKSNVDVALELLSGSMKIPTLTITDQMTSKVDIKSGNLTPTTWKAFQQSSQELMDRMDLTSEYQERYQKELTERYEQIQKAIDDGDFSNFSKFLGGRKATRFFDQVLTGKTKALETFNLYSYRYHTKLFKVIQTL